MITEFIITFREALEAALVIGIALAYLERTGNTKFNRHIYIGVAAGVIGSVIAAILFQSIAGGFEGTAEAIFEGTLMIIAVIMITWMIFWMLGQKHVKEEIEKKVKVELTEGHARGLMLFAFISVLREGVEAVIFIGAAAIGSEGESLIGAILGIAAAVVLAFLLFETAVKINIKTFFNVTSILLILFAAGILAQGIHEYQEAGVLEEQNALWSTKDVLDDNSFWGSIGHSLLGYNDQPTPYEVLAYLGYLMGISVIYMNIRRD